MKVLVVGSGGREHVLVWALSRSPRVKKIYAAPGSAGIAQLAECVDIDAGALDELAHFAKTNAIDLTVIGPEAPLAAGIADVFKAKGLKVFGPDQHASQLEGSKIFSKRMMKRCGIPTAAFEIFSEHQKALAYLKTSKYPIVIKADGLCAGKGVTVAANYKEASEAIQSLMVDRIFGDAAKQILVEECLAGVEASLIAVSDGKSVRLMASSQDHKRIFDNDEGPNTGGMGAYSPAPMVTPEMEKAAEKKIFQPVIDALREDGHPFVGFLYAGVMITAKGMEVLEFNVRFGDPEAQAVIPRLETDFAELLLAACEMRLSRIHCRWTEQSYVTVVLASKGYPASSSKGDVIRGLDQLDPKKVLVFHAGTKLENGAWKTNGGRVLNIVGRGKDIRGAQASVYEAVKQIRFDGMQYREDIGNKALNKELV
jgi:phosphoribosylamine--glycine ligase